MLRIVEGTEGREVRLHRIPAIAVALCALLLGAGTAAAIEPLPGRIHVGSETIGSATSATCGFVRTYDMGRNVSDGRAYLSRSYVYLGCRTYFNTTVERKMPLTGDATVEFSIGCEVPTYILDLEWIFSRNDEAIRSADWDPPFPTVCDSTTAVTGNVSLSTEETTYEAGDTFGLSIILWADNVEPEVFGNVYLQTADTYVRALGMGGGIEETDIRLKGRIEPGSREMPPDGTAGYTFTVTNSGSDDVDVTAQAAAVEGWSASIDPVTATVPGDGEQAFDVTLRPSADAEEGDSGQATISVTGAGREVTGTARATVVSGAASTTPPETVQDAGPAGGEATPGPGLVAALAGLAAAAHWVRRDGPPLAKVLYFRRAK